MPAARKPKDEPLLPGSTAIESIRARLVDWYRGGHRDLPWRADRDPYRILVSEAMLVQTTVAAVVPYFERFLARFPSIEALAEATEADVLKAWEGLGYYRRARQLQAAARMVVEQHGGVVPDDLDALRSLPGVGRYIAGAIASFAFDRPAPIVEANTQRVLCRVLACREPINASQTQARLWQLAERLVPDSGAGEFNQALMELGATICTSRQPSCLICPIAAFCQARAEGVAESVPIRAPKPEPLAAAELTMILPYGDGDSDVDRWLLLRRRAGGLWERFWEFPTIHLSGADPAGRGRGSADESAARFEQLTGVRVAISKELMTLRYGVTRHRVELTAVAGRRLGGRPLPDPAHPQHDRAAWLRREDIDGLTLSAPMRRLVRRLLPSP